MACSYLNFYKYSLHFELLVSNTVKNESIHLSPLHHRRKKQKDSVETRVVLQIFSLELEISEVTLHREYIKTAKNGGFCEELLSENYFEAVLVNMVLTLLMQFRRLLQIKNIITNHPRVLLFAEQAKYQSITMKKGWLLGHLRRS